MFEIWIMFRIWGKTVIVVCKRFVTENWIFKSSIHNLQWFLPHVYLNPIVWFSYILLIWRSWPSPTGRLYCRSVTYTKSNQHPIAAKRCRYKLIVAVCFCSIQHRPTQSTCCAWYTNIRQKVRKRIFTFELELLDVLELDAVYFVGWSFN